MSAPIHLAIGTSLEVLHRIITPIFSHKIQGADRFTHSGRRGTDSFEITLLPIDEFRAELLSFCDQEMVDCLNENQAHFWEGFPFPASHFLLINLTHIEVIDQNNQVTASNSARILPAALDALRLRSSAGLAWHNTYVFVRPKWIYASRMTTSRPGTRQQLMGRPESLLHAADFAACRRTIDTLLSKTWSDTITFDKVLSLATEYHRLSFTLEQVAHAFLILVVAFEALFQKDDNFSQAAKWIGAALGPTKKECKDIRKAFDDGTMCFRAIRNQIAHGDISLDLATVKANYPNLYRYLTEAILWLLELPAGSIDNTKDYYDQIGRLVEDRYNLLPRN